jgi:hypothetical protein
MLRQKVIGANLQLSLANLMFLPVAIITAPMINTLATYIGLVASPYALPKNWHSAHWMIDLGVPSDFATGHLVFLLMQLPAIVVLVLICAALFLLRNRYADQVAIVSLLALPFVDAYSVSSITVETRILLHQQSTTTFERIQFAIEYLHTQLLTALVLIAAIAAYIIGRCRLGYAASSRRNTIVVLASLSVLIGISWGLWRMT